MYVCNPNPNPNPNQLPCQSCQSKYHAPTIRGQFCNYCEDFRDQCNKRHDNNKQQHQNPTQNNEWGGGQVEAYKGE